MSEREMAGAALPDLLQDADPQRPDAGCSLFERIARESTQRYEPRMRQVFQDAGIDIEGLAEVARGNMLLGDGAARAEPPVGPPPANRRAGRIRFR